MLVLSRGGFCPKERRQHEGLLQLHREMQVGYCRLVTISTDNLLETNEFRAGVGAHWTFLSDPGRKLQKDLDIAEYTDPHHNPMIPHTLVLEPGLRVYKIYNGYWFFGRPTVEELRLDLRAVLQRCRPDWDISRRGAAGSLGEGREGGFLSVRQDAGADVRRTGLIPVGSDRVVMRTTDSNLWEAARATPTASRGGPTGPPTRMPSWCARARTSRDGCSGLCSEPSASAPWKRRSTTPSRRSKRGTTEHERRHSTRRSRRSIGDALPCADSLDSANTHGRAWVDATPRLG